MSEVDIRADQAAEAAVVSGEASICQ